MTALTRNDREVCMHLNVSSLFQSFPFKIASAPAVFFPPRYFFCTFFLLSRFPT